MINYSQSFQALDLASNYLSASKNHTHVGMGKYFH